MEETGLQQKFESRYYSPQPKCGTSSAKFVEVGANEIYLAFQVLFSGIVASIVVFIIEYCVYKRLELKG